MSQRLTESERKWRSPKGVLVMVRRSIGTREDRWSISINAPDMPKDEAIALAESMAAAIDGELPDDAPATLRAIGGERS